MADNVPVTPGVGANIATDDVGGVHYQEVKIALGLADSVDTLLDAGQQAMSNSVPVVLASDQTAVTVTANAGTNLNTSALALEAGGNLAATAASLSVVDDWDETDRAKVNLIVGQAGVQGSSGVSTATTQRVVLATDVALPTGDAGIGRVKITDGTDVADVLDLASSNPLTVAVVDGSGTQVTSFGGVGTQYTEGDVDATITGTAMMMEGAANTLVVAPGTAADGQLVNLGVNNDVTVTGTVSVTGVATEATLATLLTSSQLIDDTVVTLGTDTYTEATTKGQTIGAVRRDADTTLVNTTNEIGPLQMDANGRLKVEAFSGETLPVSLSSTTITGTVAVTQSGTWDEVGINDSSNSITVDAPVGTPVFVRLSDGASAIATLPVSLASVPSHAVTNAGTFAVQVDGAALTSLQLADDVVAVLGTATYVEATTKGTIVGAVRRDADTTLVDTTNEIGPLQMDANGRLKVEAFSGETLAVSLASTTVTGTVAVTQSGTWDEVGINDSGNVITVDGSGTAGAAAAGVVTVQGVASMTPVQVGDNSASLSVDWNGTQPVTGSGTATGALRVELPTNGTGVVGLIAGNTNIGDVDVVGGTVADSAADSGNPIKVGSRSINALPTTLVNNDRSDALSNLMGQVLVGHIDPAMQVHKSTTYTTQQTGSTLWDPTSGKKIAVTSVIISTYAVTSGRIILWFGDNADTTFTEGTDQTLVRFSAALSGTSKPGLVYCPAVPIFCTTADRELHVTSDAAMSFDVIVEGYEW